jgi:hypothetical protein
MSRQSDDSSGNYLGKVATGVKSTLMLLVLFGVLVAKVWKKDS